MVSRSAPALRRGGDSVAVLTVRSQRSDEVEYQRRCPRCRVPVAVLWACCADGGRPGRVRRATAAPLPWGGAAPDRDRRRPALGGVLRLCRRAPAAGSRPATTCTALISIFDLLRRPRWWMAVTSTLAGATLHVVALKFGPLTLVQPLGVSALVMALPIGAWFGRWKVLGRNGPRRAPSSWACSRCSRWRRGTSRRPPCPPTELAIAIGSCLGLLLLCVVLSRMLPRRAAPRGARRRLGGVLRLRLRDGPAGRRGRRSALIPVIACAGSSPSPAC